MSLLNITVTLALIQYVICYAARDCGDPGAPENGRVSLSSGTTLGSTATYSCDIGHDLIGATLRECGTDGQWTNSIPLCTSELIILSLIHSPALLLHLNISIVVDCGSLSPPIDGTVQLNGTVFGSQAMYSCDIGYSLIGVATRGCLASQNWSDTAPVCQSKLDCMRYNLILKKGCNELMSSSTRTLFKNIDVHTHTHTL